jgi:hypothetical protein
MLRDMEIEIRSPFLVNEMQSLESDSVSQSFKTAYGANDDRVMSLGFIIISLYQWEPNRPTAVMQPTQQAIEKAKALNQPSPKKYATYIPNAQEREA